MRGSTLFAFALTSGVAFALPGITLFKRASNPSKDVPFGLIAIRPGKNIETHTVTASENKFWLNKATSVVCSPEAEEMGTCDSNNKNTIFNPPQHKIELATAASKPQSAYIDSSGAFCYTSHAKPKIPKNSITSYFKYVTPTSTNGLGQFYVEKNKLVLNDAHYNWAACPIVDAGSDKKVYQIFADLGKLEDSCVEVGIWAVPYHGAKAGAYP